MRETDIPSAEGGARTHKPLARQRILSPPRLPFRHPGFVVDYEQWYLMVALADVTLGLAPRLSLQPRPTRD
jgi:hypothetical protein